MDRRNPVLLSTIVGVSVVLVVVVFSMMTGDRPSSNPTPGTNPAAAPVTASTGHRLGTTTSGTGPDAGSGGDAGPAADERLPPLVPTTTSPLRVLEIGDSLGIDLGDQLLSELDASGTATTTMASMGNSGLANTAFYDWPTELVSLLATDHPQLVVVFLGANDDQGLLVDGAAAAPGTAAWNTDYAQRVDEILREATGAGARVVWVGMPPMENADLNAAMTVENTIFQDQTESIPGTVYISSASVLGTASGLYQTSGVGPSGDEVLRTPDGVHLTPDGAGLLAAAVIRNMNNRWHLSLGPPIPAPPSTGSASSGARAPPVG